MDGDILAFAQVMTVIVMSTAAPSASRSWRRLKKAAG